MSHRLRVAVVGPCAAGKSTLQVALQRAGYDAHHPAQDHSGVPDLWRRAARPDVLIYLDVSAAAALARRPHQPHLPNLLPLQRERLAHARQHCHLYLDTSGLTPEQVQAAALAFLADLQRADDGRTGAAAPHP